MEAYCNDVVIDDHDTLQVHAHDGVEARGDYAETDFDADNLTLPQERRAGSAVELILARP